MKLSTIFHPQTDGQEARAIKTLEDMIKSCGIDFKGYLYDHLPFMSSLIKIATICLILWILLKHCMVEHVSL